MAADARSHDALSLNSTQDVCAKCMNAPGENAQRVRIGKSVVSDSVLHAGKKNLSTGNDVRQHRHERFPQLVLGPHTPGAARGGGDDQYRLAAKTRCERWARRPVKRVLQHSRHPVVVLGRCDHDAVASLDLVAQFCYRRQWRIGV